MSEEDELERMFGVTDQMLSILRNHFYGGGVFAPRSGHVWETLVRNAFSNLSESVSRLGELCSQVPAEKDSSEN